MSLSQALSISLSGLRATQSGLSLVAGNVANAQTPGYVRKSLSQETTFAGGIGGGVRVAAVNRVLDEFVQRQLRVETSGGSYAATRASLYQRLQQVYGQPGTDSSFETIFNNFTTAVQQLGTSPESMAARSIVLSSGQVLAQYFNGMTADVQALRGDAEKGLADAVASANAAMQKIATINGQLAHAPPGDVATAVLKDQRDVYVDQLSQLMDIKVVVGDLRRVQRVHQFRRPTGGHAGRQAFVQCAGHRHAGDAVERRPRQERARHADADGIERQFGGPACQ